MPRILCVFAALLCAAPSLTATVVLPAEFREIVSGSQVIVYGRVVAVQPEWTADRRQIESVVTVEVRTYLKGGPGEHVTFRIPGGQIGRYKSLTVGAPAFQAGEEAVLFLTARGPSMARVFGLYQGVYRVQVDRRSGRRLVVPPALLAKGPEAERVTRGAADRPPLPLEAFAGQVRDTLAQTGGAR